MPALVASAFIDAKDSSPFAWQCSDCDESFGPAGAAHELTDAETESVNRAYVTHCRTHHVGRSPIAGIDGQILRP